MGSADSHANWLNFPLLSVFFFSSFFCQWEYIYLISLTANRADFAASQWSTWKTCIIYTERTRSVALLLKLRQVEPSLKVGQQQMVTGTDIYWKRAGKKNLKFVRCTLLQVSKSCLMNVLHLAGNTPTWELHNLSSKNWSVSQNKMFL